MLRACVRPCVNVAQFSRENSFATHSPRKRTSTDHSLMSWMGLASRVTPVQTALRNSTRDEGGPFGFGDQESIPSHRKLLWSKAMVVSVAEKSGQ
jgi:hypothetical protein